MKLLTILLTLYSHFTESSEIKLSVSANFKKFSSLAACVNEIIAEAFTIDVDTVTFILPESKYFFEVDDFKDELFKKISAKPNVAIHQELVSKLIDSPSRLQRRYIILLINSFKDFLKAFKVLSPELFRFNGYCIIALVNGEISEIEQMFSLLWNNQIYNVIVLFRNDDNAVLIKTFMPFNSEKCNDTTPVVINVFKDGKFVNGIKLLFPKKMKNLHNCPVRVSISNTTEPPVITDKFTNGSYHLKGRDINLIKTLSRTLNFKIDYSYIGIEGFIYENGTSEGPLKSLLIGESDLSISDWILKKNRLKFFDFTTSYIFLQVILVVPPGRDYTTFEKLIFPFSITLWISILLCFFVGILVIYVVKFRSKATRNFVFGTGVKNPYLNIIVGFLGGSQRVLPKQNFARFLLMIFLMYSLVMRTVYQGSYYKILQSSNRKSEIQSIDEMIAQDFRFYIFLGLTDVFQETEAVRNK